MVRTLGAATVLLLCAATAAGQTRGDERYRRELLRAEALERAGQLTLALAAVDSLLTVAPAEPAALLLAERVYRRLGRLDALPPVLERALRLDPSAVLVWQMALRTLSELGRYEEFRAAGERWLRLTPGSAVAYREYATALRRIGEPAEAEVVLRRGQTQVDRPEVLAVELADLYRDQGRWSEAAESWVALFQVSASFALDLIITKLERAGVDSRPLAVALLRLVEDEPSLEARELAALAALYAGRSDLSRQSAELVMGGLDRRARQLFVGRFAKTAEEQGHPALSAWAYRELMRNVDEDAARWELARQVVKYDIAAGDTADALATLEELTGSASPKSGAHRWASTELIRTLASTGEVGRAGRALKLHARLYGNDPELPALALAVAAANLRLGYLEESRQVLELVPVATGASVLAGRMAATAAQLALYSGDYTAAREAFEQAVPTLAGEERREALRLLRFLRDGNEAELMAVAAAHRRARQEEWVAAVDALRAGLRRAPPSRARPALLLWSAELALAGAELEQAATMLNLIVERYPHAGEAPVALMRLAEALAGDGRGLEAIALLEDLILRYPDSALTPVARRRLAELREEVPKS